MESFILVEVLMIIQLALLLLHQMDSTYFKEWEMMPFLKIGYVPFFIVTIFLTAIQIFGIFLLIDRNVTGVLIAIIWGFIGLAVPAFHTYHYIKGAKEFRNFWSALIIYLILINSVLLLKYGFEVL